MSFNKLRSEKGKKFPRFGIYNPLHQKDVMGGSCIRFGKTILIITVEHWKTSAMDLSVLKLLYLIAW